MGKRWRIHPHDAQRIAQLERSARVSPVVAQLLLCRGITEPAAVRDFLDVKLNSLRDPEELPGLSEAAELIWSKIAAGQRIVVYGDYDADGMTAAAILMRCLQVIGGNAGYYVPSRLDEGYGLNNEALDTLARRGTDLVITVDCGIASVAEAQHAKELGLQLVITDHHLMAEQLPAADAIVHPRLPGMAEYPHGQLCGAGVAFKLAWALCQRASGGKRVTEGMRSFLMSAIALAAIGTVADVVPLLGENRVLVRHGLKSLKAFPLLGLEKLMQVAGIADKPSLQTEDIAFSLGPRLNAAGRLGQAQLGIELLTTDSAERSTALAEHINNLNGNRESLERSIYLSARKQAVEHFDPENDPALVLADRDWHAGVIGIVASRLVEKFHRPVVMISLDPLGGKPGTGSARTACGLHLHRALGACRDHLLTHGGHAAAAGLRVEESQIDAFRAAFCELAAREISQEDRIAEVKVDAEAPLSQLTYNTVRQIETLAPFGQGNPRPVLCCGNIQLSEAPRRIGAGERHLSVKMQQGRTTMRAVAFGQGEWAEQLAQSNGPLEIAYRPVINEYRGRRSVELQLVDWNPATASQLRAS